MYTHFTFKDGSNPYITTSNKALWKMIKNYILEQIGENSFKVIGRAQVLTAKRSPSAYSINQETLRDFAICWQQSASEFDYSYSKLSDWADFFTEYGKKYGLISEFKENWII